jgi:hypothetical protein
MPVPEKRTTGQRRRIYGSCPRRGNRALSCPAMKKPREVLQPRWAVYRLGGKRAERILFTVTAPNSDATIERVIKEYEIPEHERWRISVQREA